MPETKVDLSKAVNWLLGLLVALLGTLFVNVQKDAAIALDVVKQHGEEFNQVRSELAAIKLLMEQKTRERYTASDAERDNAYFERRLREVEEGCLRQGSS